MRRAGSSTYEAARQRFPEGIPDRLQALLDEELPLIAERRYAHRPRHRSLRAPGVPPAGPVPRLRVGGQVSGLLAARRHLDRSDARRSARPASEDVAADYQTTRLSLKDHPMRFLRPLFDALGRRTAGRRVGFGTGGGRGSPASCWSASGRARAMRSSSR
jgi:hypothetical protein